MREFKIIDEIRCLAGKPGKGVIAGIGDDCAVLEYSKREYMLWAADMLVEGTHFTIKDAGYSRIGRKAAAVNISDIAAMGGCPKYVTVSLGMPKSMSVSDVRKLYRGITGICSEYGIKVIGGDTNRSDKLVIDVSIMGFVEKKRLSLRSGAKAGDIILITGPVKNGKKTHLDFEPRIKESRALTRKYTLSSMIDVSDGIGPDLGRICSESRVGARLYADAVPLTKGLSLDDALHYGESFELLFTMPPKEARKLLSMAARDKDLSGCFVIGEIVPRTLGVRLIGKNGSSKKLTMEGFRHLG